MRKMIKSCKNKSVIWNTKCKDGWKKYQEITEENDELVKLLDKLYEKRKHLIESEQTEKEKDVEIEITEKLFELQRSAYEKEATILNEIENNRGNQATLFKLKARILGEKKSKTHKSIKLILVSKRVSEPQESRPGIQFSLENYFQLKKCDYPLDF